MFRRRFARVVIADLARVLAPAALLFLALTLQAPPLGDYVAARVRHDVVATRGAIGSIAGALGRHLGDSSIAVLARAAIASASGGAQHRCPRSG
ncbi:MAG TPA: hypothetical protein VF041_11205 [Gemmatimonadaceae bacterium]